MKLKYPQLFKVLSLIATATPLAASGAAPAIVDKNQREKFLRVENMSASCKLDDASLVKLLYLECLSDRDRNSVNHHDLRLGWDCLDPANVISPPLIGFKPAVPAPPPVRNARLALHSLFEKHVLANPDPGTQFRDLQKSLAHFAECKIDLLIQDRRGEKKSRYSTDLADMLGLSYTESSYQILANWDKQNVFPGGMSTDHWRMNYDALDIRREGNRYLPSASFWLKYQSLLTTMGYSSPLRAFLMNPSEILYRAYGEPKMTSGEIHECVVDEGTTYRSYWRGYTLWNDTVSSLVPPAERSALLFSDTALDAQVLNYSLGKSSEGYGHGKTEAKNARECDSKEKPKRRK